MPEFEIPEGFDDDTVAIEVPEEYFLEFLEYLESMNYRVNVEYLLRWANQRASETHKVFFHHEDGNDIQAFTEESFMFDDHVTVNLNILSQPVNNCEELLNLL